MAFKATTTVRLDRSQREAIRQQIVISAGACEDIPLYIKDPGYVKHARAYFLETIAELENLVAVLDAIGWEETEGAGDEEAVEVDKQIARWAAHEATVVQGMFGESVGDEDRELDAYTGLRRIADAGFEPVP